MSLLEMKSEELITNLQIASSSNETLRRYLSDIFEDISFPNAKNKSSKALDLIGFHDFLDFPMLISEKLFNAFDLDNNGELNQEYFIKGMEALFCANSIDSFTQLLFRMFDFDIKGLALIYNIKILLVQFHLRNAKHVDTAPLVELLNDCLGKDHSFFLTYHFFISKLAENADVLYLFLSFVYKYFNKEKECLQYYSKVISKTISNGSDASFSNKKTNQTRYTYGAPTQKLLKYIKEELDINLCYDQWSFSDLDDTSCDELSQLDDFESEIRSCMLVHNIESPFTTTMHLGNSEIKYKSMNMSPLLSFEKNLNINSENDVKRTISKHYSSSSPWGLSSLHLLNMNNSLSSSNDNTNNHSLNATSLISLSPKSSTIKYNTSKAQEFICTCYLNGSKEGNKFKMIFVGNNLFCFKFAEQSNLYIYEGLRFLKKNYIEKTQEITNDQFRLTLTSDYGGNVKTDRLYFEDRIQCELFYEECIQVIKYRNIKDDVLILNEFNSGNCGSIFMGFSNTINKKVCIKKINKKEKAKPELKLIRWEKDVTQLLIQLNHKNIMEAYDIYEDEANVYLILEYIEGVSLSTYSYKSAYDKRHIMHQLIEGLQFLHKNSIVHRDIKHDNIMINNHGTNTVKIVDFGFARILTKYDTAKEYCGSICFTAPEILLNNPYGSTVDVWSLGVLIFWINYGVLPFRSTHNHKKTVTRKVIQGIIDDKLNGCFGDKLVLMCLRTDYKERSSLKCLLNSFDIRI